VSNHALAIYNDATNATVVGVQALLKREAFPPRPLRDGGVATMPVCLYACRFLTPRVRQLLANLESHSSLHDAAADYGPWRPNFFFFLFILQDQPDSLSASASHDRLLKYFLHLTLSTVAPSIHTLASPLLSFPLLCFHRRLALSLVKCCLPNTVVELAIISFNA